MLKITQSNKKEYIGKDFIFKKKKDNLVIGWKVLGLGKQFEIPCEDVKEFKVLDEKSKPIKTTAPPALILQNGSLTLNKPPTNQNTLL